MPSFYVYLISSLPALSFGAKPPFSFERLLEICRGLIPEKDSILLSALNEMLNGDAADAGNRSLGLIQAFERNMRNELVKVRATRFHLDAEKYLRPGEGQDASVGHVALASYRNPSIIEGERLLDAARWEYLDGISIGHYFDLDALIIYAAKLLILERWQKVNSAPKEKLLNETLA